MELNPRAYNQLLSILDNLKESEYCKIPESQIALLESRKDKEYVYYYNVNKSLKQNKILPDTILMLLSLWDMYIATDKQHEKLTATLLEKDFKEEQDEAIKKAQEAKKKRKKKSKVKQTKISITKMQGDIIIEATEEKK
jgi:hypothetical protein